jgi:hypothetical protein
MEKVLQILVVLALLMLAVTYYIKAEKVRFRPYYPIGRFNAPNDLLWNMPGIDPDNQLLFLAGNEGMVEVLDSNTRELITQIPVGEDPGALVFDSETRYLYSANGEGTVSVIRQVNRNTYKTLQTLVTRQGCSALSLDTRTKKIYLPVTGFMPERESAVDCWVYSNQ